jgi:hypothetical protein
MYGMFCAIVISMSETAALQAQLPVTLIARSETELTGEIEPIDLWSWVQELRRHGFLVVLSTSGLDAQRNDQRLHFKVREQGE